MNVAVSFSINLFGTLSGIFGTKHIFFIKNEIKIK